MSTQPMSQRLTPTVFEEADPFGLLLIVIQSLLLVGAAAAFFFQSPWTMPLLLAFLLVSGVAWGTRQAVAARVLTFLMTITTVVTLALIAIFLFLEAIPAFQLMGIDILLPLDGDLWNPSTNTFSLVPMIWGTAITTVVATLVAGPLGVAGALFISEIAPEQVREVVKPGVEILAGIPSIVYGFIGFTIINPYVSTELSTGFGALLPIGVVIGLMALPTVVSVAEDAISTVPEAMKSGSLAMGATDWQTMKSVTVPAAFSGISAAVLLGIGRAIGETMAATVMIAHVQELPQPAFDVFDSGETLTTLIAGNFGPAVGTEYYLSALFAAGVVLFVIVTTLSIASQYIEKRMQRKLGGDR
ncbi:phosphate ABC transporter permease subunit PstC [Halorhabdus utahensis]|nr:phosphate ABC transporter permease subunit PstC [Halorhabdus utahensis]